MDSCFIDDGYEQTDTIPAAAGLHGALTYTYRPGLYEARLRFRNAASADERTRVAHETIRGHLVSWDATDGRGAAVKVGMAAIAKLHPAIVDAMVDTILGYSAAKAAGRPSDDEADAKN